VFNYYTIKFGYQQYLRQTKNLVSGLDLKAHHHGLRYAQEVFKILPENTKLIGGMIPLGQKHNLCILNIKGERER